MMTVFRMVMLSSITITSRNEMRGNWEEEEENKEEIEVLKKGERIWIMEGFRYCFKSKK